MRMNRLNIKAQILMTPIQVPTNPLKWATRVVTCFKDGFGIGSIEGRVAIQCVPSVELWVRRSPAAEGITKSETLGELPRSLRRYQLEKLMEGPQEEFHI